MFQGAGANDFKAAMDKVDEEYLKEMMQHQSDGQSEDSTATKAVVSVKDDGTTQEDIEVTWRS